MDKYQESLDKLNELIKELKEFNELMYGYELSSTECKELTDYISKLEKALDKACQILEDNVYDLVIEKDGVFKKAIEDEELSKFNVEDFNVEYLSENGIYKGNFKRWLLKDE